MFTVNLRRTDNLSPRFAKFHVPLWFSKLDLRDYLYHVYDVRILGVRSYVKVQPIKRGTDDVSYPKPKRWYRPPAQKFMTVQLEEPFVWPQAPGDFAPWSKSQLDQQREDQKKEGEPEERNTSMREQARALLEGRVKWKPTEHRGMD